MIDLLLKYGFDINAVDDYGDTPLLFGIKDTILVQNFLDRGADPSIYNDRGSNALMLATEQNNVPLMTLLLNRGIDINSMNYHRYTALMYGAYYCVKNAVRILIDYDADLNLQDDNLDTALHIATSKGCSEVVDLLLKAGAKISLVNSDNYTPEAVARLSHYDSIADTLHEASLPRVKSAYRR
jgi:ankyrin repeat protein